DAPLGRERQARVLTDGGAHERDRRGELLEALGDAERLDLLPRGGDVHRARPDPQLAPVERRALPVLVREDELLDLAAREHGDGVLDRRHGAGLPALLLAELGEHLLAPTLAVAVERVGDVRLERRLVDAGTAAPARDLDHELRDRPAERAAHEPDRAHGAREDDELGPVLRGLTLDLGRDGLGVALPRVLRAGLDPLVREPARADLVDHVVAALDRLRLAVRHVAARDGPRDVRALAVHDDPYVVDRLVRGPRGLQQRGHRAPGALGERRRVLDDPVDEHARLVGDQHAPVGAPDPRRPQHHLLEVVEDGVGRAVLAQLAPHALPAVLDLAVPGL